MNTKIRFPIMIITFLLMLVSLFWQVFGREIPREDGIYNDSCGDSATWSFNTYNSTLYISGSGEMYDYSNGGQPWYEHQSKITTVSIAKGITYLGIRAFADCTALKTVKIPATVQTVGSRVFSGCSALTTIEINSANTYLSTDSNGALYDKDKTFLHFVPSNIGSSFYIPDTVTGMQVGTFDDCKELTKLVLSTAMSSAPFESLPVLHTFLTIEVPAGNTHFSSHKGILYDRTMSKLIFCPRGFSGSYEVPSDVITIGDKAFAECKGLSSVSFPNSVSSIGFDAFRDCSSMTQVTLGSGLQTIGTAAFEGTPIKSIILPEGLTSVGGSAFSNCKELEVVSLPQSLTSIPYSMFSGCEKVKELTLGDGVASIMDCAFESMTSLEQVYMGINLKSLGSGAFLNCTSLKSIVLPDTLKTMGKECFSKCTSLTSVDIGDSLIVLPENAFYGCYRLANVTLGRALTTISKYAFCSTGDLRYLSIPEGVQTLQSYAFSSSGLVAISLPDTLKTIGQDCFRFNSALDHVMYRGTDEQWGAVKLLDTHKVFSSEGLHTEASKNEISIRSGCQYNAYFCSRCNANFGYSEKSVYCHNYNADGLCEACGNLSCLSYYCNTYNKSIKITGFDNSVTNLVIPDTIEGLPVTEIDQKVFSKSNLITVVLGDHITTIQNEAFSQCEELEALILSPVLTHVGDYAIAHCSKLTELRFPSTLTTMGTYALYDNAMLRHVELNTGLSVIESYVLYKCPSLQSIVLGEALKTIKSNAFYYCDKLYHIVYAGTDEQWKAITVQSGNTPFTSVASFNIHTNTSTNPVVYTDTCCGYHSFCKLCNHTLRYYAVEGRDHIMDAGVCVHCGVPSYLEYRIAQSCIVSITGYDGSVEEIVLPDRIEQLDVHSIDTDAFANEEHLRSIILNPSLQNIESGAFRNCSALENIDFANSVSYIEGSAFSGCTKLTEIVLPHKMKDLGPSAFSGCSSLVSVVLPDDLDLIDNNTFLNCTALESVQFPSCLEYIWDGAFKNCDSLVEVRLPDTFLTLGADAFYDCDKLESVHLGEGFRGMNTRAFYDCDSLKSIYIPISCEILSAEAFFHCDSLNTAVIAAAEIKDRAFAECGSLEDLTLAEGLRIIRYQAFGDCPHLKRVSLPTSLERSEASAFYNCTGIERVDITDIVPWCGVYFGNLPANPMYFGALYINGELPVDLVLPEGMEQISDYAFLNCKSLESITLPFYATRIGTSAFSGCSSLKSLYIPSSVTEIGDHAFTDCTALSSVTISGGITTLEAGTFSYCNALKVVNLPDTLTEISDYAFYCCKELRSISVPYALANIREFAFDGCKMLSHVLYAGNSSRWNSISIERNNDVLSLATIHTNTDSTAVTWKSLSGESYLYCSICDLALTEKPRCLHEDMHLINDYAPTCSSAGYSGDVICLICDEIVQRGEILPPLEHSGYTVNKVDPTCTQPGYSGDTYCSVCGASISVGEVLPALQHPDTYTQDPLSPTCTEDGYTGDTVCRLCNEILVAGTVLPPLNHPETMICEAIEPGCNYPGYSGDVLCLTCGVMIRRGEELPATGHRYVNGVCNTCGQSDPNFVPIPDENPFTDVAEDAYYHTPVLWAVSNKITTGVNSHSFAPDKPCTRAQIVTFLWRSFGSPEPISNHNPFTDVPSNSYYYKAVLWAVEMGITTGTSKTAFSPEKTCTRGQVATFLWRAKGKPQPISSNNPFGDVSPDAYYYSAILWAVETGVTNGTGGGRFSPDGNCTRGQIVTFLYRAMQ